MTHEEFDAEYARASKSLILLIGDEVYRLLDEVELAREHRSSGLATRLLCKALRNVAKAKREGMNPG